MGRSLGTLEGAAERKQLAEDAPRLFTSAEEFESWAGGAQRPVHDLGDPVDLTGVDFGTEVVIADVVDTCDAAQAFISEEPGEIRSRLYDPTPDDSYACGAPSCALNVSAVTLEELGLDSPTEITVA